MLLNKDIANGFTAWQHDDEMYVENDNNNKPHGGWYEIPSLDDDESVDDHDEKEELILQKSQLDIIFA